MHSVVKRGSPSDGIFPTELGQTKRVHRQQGVIQGLETTYYVYTKWAACYACVQPANALEARQPTASAVIRCLTNQPCWLQRRLELWKYVTCDPLGAGELLLP